MQAAKRTRKIYMLKHKSEMLDSMVRIGYKFP